MWIPVLNSSPELNLNVSLCPDRLEQQSTREGAENSSKGNTSRRLYFC